MLRDKERREMQGSQRKGKPRVSLMRVRETMLLDGKLVLLDNLSLEMMA
jgi:hypothetical protein